PKREFWSKRKLIALAIILAALIAVVVFALTRSKQVDVPPVIGRGAAAAERILEEAGFEVARRTIESCDDPRTVIEQDPPGGTQADEGSTVTITVSLGSEVEVPNVAGSPANEAASQLKDA